MTSAPAIVIDRSHDSLVVVRFQRVASDAEFQQYLADYRRLLADERRFAPVFVTTPEMPATPTKHARWQADFMRDEYQLISERVVATAFSLPSSLMRGVLRGILMLQPMACPYTVVATEAEGVAWVRARLWTDQVRRLTNA